MKIKQILAGVTALTILGSTSGMTVLADEFENQTEGIKEVKTTDTVNSLANATETDPSYFSYSKVKKGDSYTITITGFSSKIAVESRPSTIIFPDFIEDYPVTSIKGFGGNTSLTYVKLPMTLEKIETNAFSGDTALTYVEMPPSLTSIESNAFQNCSLMEVDRFPTVVNGIGSYAFSNCSKITDAVISGGTIKGNAFGNCTSLKNVTIGSNVTQVNASAFENCTSLESVSISEGLSTFGGSVFKGCSALTSISLPNSLIKMDKSCFENCTALSTVSIGSGINSLPEYSFFGCTSLQNVNITEGVQTLGNDSFRECSSLTDISIPNSVVSIGERSFYKCTNLANIAFPLNLTSIGEYAFSNCSSLINAELPDSVNSIGKYAFAYCSSLEEVHIPSHLTVINQHTFIQTSIKKLELYPNMSINTNAFRECKNLEELVIPDNCKVNQQAFYNCTGLKRLTIGKNVQFSGGYCNFGNDFNLEYITSYSDFTWGGLFGYTYDFKKLKSIDLYNNSNYTTKDGVLYSKDMTQLICLPPYLECEDNTFVIPETVTNVNFRSFSDTHTVQKVIALDNDERKLSYPYNTITYGDPNGIEKFYYYNGKKPLLNADWTAVNLGAKKDKKIENYTIQVIDLKTGDKYSNVIVETEDHKYATITDEEGMAVFEVSEDDEEFWNKRHKFNVVYAIPEEKELSTLTYSTNEKLDSSSTKKKIGSETLVPSKNGVDNIKISNKIVTAVRYNGSSAFDPQKPNNPYNRINGNIYINEIYDSALPSGDTLTIDFGDIVPGNDYQLSIAITNAKISKDHSGNVQMQNGKVQMLDYVVVQNMAIGDNSSMTFDNFSDLFSENLTSDIDITPDSRFKITVEKIGQKPNYNNDYYLYYAPILYNDSSSEFGLFDAGIISKCFGSFSKNASFDKIPNLDASFSLNLTKKTVEFEASCGLAGTKRKKADKVYGETKNLTEEQMKQRKIDEFYDKYPIAKNCVNNDGTPVTNAAQFAASDEAWQIFKQSCKEMDWIDRNLALGEMCDKPVTPYFDFYAFANGSGKIKDSSIKISYDLGFGLDLGVKGEYRIPQLANLAYISASVGGGTKLKAYVDEATFIRLSGNDRLQFQNLLCQRYKVDLKLNAKIAGGVGVGDIVDANIAAKLEGKTTYDLNDSKFKNGKVDGTITLSAKILAWKNSYDMTGFSATLIDENGNPDDYIEYELFGKKHNNREGGTIEEKNIAINDNMSADLYERASETASASDFTLIRRKTETVDENTAIYAESNELGTALESSISETETVAQNVYELSDPVMISAGGSDYLFRFIDDTTRTTANGSTLVYSKKVNGEWSDPVKISDNGTADFDASVCSDGTNIYISWCDIGSVISDDSLYTDAIKASTISVAKLDTSADSITLLGSTSVRGQSNLSPSISVKNGTGIVAWVSNANYDPLTNTGNDEIYYSVISGNSLSSPQKYVSSGEGKIIGSIDTGYIDSKLSIAYSIVEKGGNAESSEIFASSYTGTPIQLTSNNLVDSRPQFEKLDGKDVLFWYFSNNIIYTESLDSQPEFALTGLIDDRYAIASSGNITKIAWRDQNEENIDVLKMAAYENGEFTNNYIGNELGLNPSVFSATIDSSNNLQVAYTYQNGLQQDLVITKEMEAPAVNVVSAIVGADYHSGDETVPLDLTIKNSGNRDLSNITVNISDAEGNVVASCPTELEIAIGTSKECTINAAIPQVTKLTTYTVSVDGVESETADFTVGYASIHLDGEVYQAGGQRFANVICKNNSNISSGGFLMVYIDGELLSATTISNIDSTANSLSQFNLTELAGGNSFTSVDFKLDGTKENDYSGLNSLHYEFDEISDSITAPDIIEVTENGVIKWALSDSATSYNIYRSETEDGEKISIGEAAADVSEYTDSTAESGKTYYYFVEAVNSESGETAMSEGVYVEIHFEVVTKVAAEGITVLIKADNTENAVSYCWQINDGNGWISLDGAEYMTDTLTISPVETSQDNYKYRCIIKTDNDEEVFSTVTELEVIASENVTESMVSNMTVEECIEFVNYFNKKNDQTENSSIILTSAQLKAIELVLSYDYSSSNI